MRTRRDGADVYQVRVRGMRVELNVGIVEEGDRVVDMLLDLKVLLIYRWGQSVADSRYDPDSVCCENCDECSAVC